MMKIFGSSLCALLFVAVITADAGAFLRSNVSHGIFLIGSQNQSFEPKPSRSYKLAKVHFVVDKSGTIGFDDKGEYIGQLFDHNDARRCKDLGFNLAEDCPDNYFKSRLCPYNNAYYDRCCSNNYKYSKAECSYPNTISSASCGGKYKCYCDSALYPYTSSNCAAPKELSDKCVDAAGSHYSQCNCPSYYKPCDASKNLVGIGTGCNRNGETVYAACDCKAGYNQVCEQFGPTNANDYCQNGGKYYKACKTCPNKGTLDRCLTGFACTLEQCSGKFYITGCETGYKDISNCSWMKCWLPFVTNYTGDESGGDNTDPKTDCAYAAILYGDGTCAEGALISGKTPVAVVFDDTNRLAAALNDIDGNSNDNHSYVKWSGNFCDTPLQNCTINDIHSGQCETDGRYNTNLILTSAACSGEVDAANAVTNYMPNGCTANFCQKNKWFLPSLAELKTLLNQIHKIDTTFMDALKRSGGSINGSSYYWSSNEGTDSEAWSVSASDGEYRKTKSAGSYVRPIVKY